jgi:ATP-dependent DNA helicase RecG
VHRFAHHTPAPLTPGQLHALAEIETDLASSTRMVRLLQGDVGSGKTLVAFLASAHAIEAGYQVAFLVPTEILAQQHAQNLKSLGKKLALKSRSLQVDKRKKPLFMKTLPPARFN